MPKGQTYQLYTMIAAGGTTSLSCKQVVDSYNFIPNGGSILLAGNIIITYTDTPSEGMEFNINYGGGVIYDGGTVTIFGKLLTAQEALTPYNIKATYINGTFVVMIYYSALGYLTGVNIETGTINGGTAIASNSITPDRFVNAAARGYMFRAGGTGIWQTFNAATSGNILQGNGTDVVSNTVSGDITISNTGVAAIGAGKVTKTMLSYTPVEYYIADLTISSAQILALNGTPLTIVSAPGAGYYIDVVSATSQMTFGSAAYATNTTLQLINTGAAVAQMQDTAILLSTVNKNTKFSSVTAAAAGQTQVIVNTDLQVKVATANPITGDSAIKVSVIYRIVTV
jgi:hypothetical protein